VSGTLLKFSSTSTQQSIISISTNLQPPVAFTSCALLVTFHTSLCRPALRKRLFINHFEGNHHRCRSTIILSNQSLIALAVNIPQASLLVPLPPLNLCQASVIVVVYTLFWSPAEALDTTSSVVFNCRQFPSATAVVSTTAQSQQTASLLQHQASTSPSTVHAVSSRLPVNPNTTL
jgi:hypothetical protein